MPEGYRRRPNTPSEVERALRQEAGFGCARCGHPYIEYHHIIPFSEEQHFRPKDMIAVCGNCHSAIAKQGRDRQYELKGSPFNVRRRAFNGALEYDKRDLVFRVGGNWYENVGTILQFGDIPIIRCRIDEGQAKISLNLFDPLGQKTLSVVDNQINFRIDDLWDFEYHHNLVIARYGPRRIALTLDFRGSDAKIEGNLWLGQSLIRLGPEETHLPQGGMISNCGVSNCSIGIQIGQPGGVQEDTLPYLLSRGVRCNAPCPCGSRERFKRCCGVA